MRRTGATRSNGSGSAPVRRDITHINDAKSGQPLKVAQLLNQDVPPGKQGRQVEDDISSPLPHIMKICGGPHASQ